MCLSRGPGDGVPLFSTESGGILSQGLRAVRVCRGWRLGAPPLGAEGRHTSLEHGGTRPSPGQRGGAFLEDGEMARNSWGQWDGILLREGPHATGVLEGRQRPNTEC